MLVFMQDAISRLLMNPFLFTSRKENVHQIYQVSNIYHLEDETTSIKTPLW